MSRGAKLALLAAAALAALCVAQLARVGGALGLARVDLEHAGLVRLDPRAARALAELDAEVTATLCISARETMPSSERRLERDLVGLLERMRAANPARFDYRVVDPDSDPELARYLAGQGVAPVRAAEIRADARAERSVHATLMLAYGVHGKSSIRGLTQRRVRDVELLIVQHLAELARPSRPRVLVAGARDARAMVAWIAERADVVELDFDRDPRLADDADLFVWIDPGACGDAHLVALRRWLDRGRHALVAGSSFSAREIDVGGAPDLAIEPNAPGLATLLSEFGLRPSGEVVIEPREREHLAAIHAPSHAAAVESNANAQDFRGFASQPNGNLLLVAPNAIEIDGAKLVELDATARVLAATSSEAQRAPAQSPLRASDIEPLGERPREPLVVLIAPRDAWRGGLTYVASSSPLTDGQFDRPEFAHRELLGSWLSTFSAPEHLARNRGRVREVETLPALSPRERLAWRALVIGLVPAAVLLLALARGALAPGWIGRGRGARDLGFAFGLVALLALGGLVLGALPDPARVDATDAGVHELAPKTIELARAIADQPTRVELIFSRSLPPSIAAVRARARVLCADLERSGAELAVQTVAFDELDLARRSELEALGVRARAVESRDETATTLRSVVAALRLRRGDRDLVLDVTAPDALGLLEFRVAAALARLGGARRAKVALAADTPRLSPAEAREQYEQRQLFAPSESDVYGQARELLRRNDFDVVAIDPARPRGYEDADLLIWLQPRRETRPMMNALVEHLRRGRDAIVAGQHFIVQSRQLERNALALGHWPRPQYADLERGYLADLGLALAREVLCDANAAERSVQTEFEHEGERTLERTTSVQPFWIRASAARYDVETPLMRGLGDLVMPGGNRWLVEREKLVRAGLRARTLATTSADAWAIDWKGGDLAAASLEASSAQRLGPQALALLVEGRFPLPGLEREEAAPPARLMLVGCSELFKNAEIQDPEALGGPWLVQAAATLALGDGLGAIAARRIEPPGFDAPPDQDRLAWRAIVLAAGPAGLLVLALILRLASGRSVLPRS